MATKKEIEKAQFLQRVKAVLSEAREVSRQLTDEYVASTHECFFECSGSATLWIYKPSYRFREALRHLNAIDRWLNGQWEIKADDIDARHNALRGVTLREVACRAALMVFEREFPEEGRYSVHTWID